MIFTVIFRSIDKLNFRNHKDFQNIEWPILEILIAGNSSKSDEQLYEEIAKSLSKDNLTIGHSEDDDSSSGRQFFLSKYKLIQKHICGNDHIKSLMSKSTNDAELIILVAGVLAGPFSSVVAVFAAILVTRRGLQSFCKGADMKADK